MSGVFTYVSFLAVYYLLLVGLDLFGSFMEYRKSILMVLKIRLQSNSKWISIQILQWRP